VSKSCKELKKV